MFQVSAALDLPLIFGGDAITATINFNPKEPIHLLTAVVSIQTGLHLGDLIQADKFNTLRARGPLLGHHDNNTGGILSALGINTTKFNDLTLYRSEQQLLCADAHLDSSREFSAKFEIPKELSPSYNSKTFSVNHQLVLEFQIMRDARPAPSVLLLPFKIYPRPNDVYNLLENISPSSSLQFDKQLIIKHVQSLLAHQKERTPMPEEPIRSELLPTQVKYELQRAKFPLATLHLARPFIHVGDTLTATVDLSPQCFYFTATLEMVETIDEGFATANTEFRKIICTQNYMVYGLEKSVLQMPVPFNVTPKLSFNQIHNSFNLRLDLLCVQEALLNPQPKQFVQTEHVSSNVPITIVSPTDGGTSPFRTWKFKD